MHAETGDKSMTYKISELADLGWTAFYSSQLDTTDLETHFPVKVAEVHRNNLRVVGTSLDCLVPPFYDPDGDDEAQATVGDWLLLDRETLQPQRLLDRKSLFKRFAPGTGRKIQLIAANIDTLFIVSSCNQDFNIARLERYLALALDADILAVIVLTKADLTDVPEDYERDAAKLIQNLSVVVLDARNSDDVKRLLPWCGKGQTVAFVGSSGVGKSTIINTLTGMEQIATQDVREDDAKGRHTTTSRELHLLHTGGWLLDTPGIRELQLTDVQAGLGEVFADITKLAQSCRFRDCAHETEPECAIRAAVEAGELDENRLQRWKKLVAEDAYNTESLIERRAKDKTFGKMIKRVKQDTRK
ncbi:MAG: ribosome small subunit-dependent GTPase A [Hyphomicrobiales bacterium]|nr:MAG: ribosome small subunit-dependent GTPase A [Hyphomicrobiales bacterium]